MYKTHTLYLDMDGVLADFNRAARELLGATLEQERAAAAAGRWTPQDWQQIQKNPNFYRNLPKTEIADDLVQQARQFRDNLNWNLYVLTAIPRHNDMPDAFHDKILWIQDYYPDLRVRFGPYSRDKAAFAQPGDILIDDRSENCQDWTNQGGTAIRVLDHERIKAVNSLFTVYKTQLKHKDN
jgi:5'(3')-deoxyribonucleotidase